MLKVIIVDDEQNARITLRSLLDNYTTNVKVVDECANVIEAVQSIKTHKPDLVFLDIEMPEYNGFELLKFFPEISFHIVFVTAYSNYAIKAFEVSAIDYLLKPVEIESLQNAVGKAQNKMHSSTIEQQLNLLKESYEGDNIQKIALPFNGGLLFAKISEIVLLEADRVYTDFYLVNGSKITVSKPLKVFEDILAQRNFMFRAHRSHLINLNYIHSYNRASSTITMENQKIVALARDRKQLFETLLKTHRLIL